MLSAVMYRSVACSTACQKIGGKSDNERGTIGVAVGATLPYKERVGLTKKHTRKRIHAAGRLNGVTIRDLMFVFLLLEKTEIC